MKVLLTTVLLLTLLFCPALLAEELATPKPRAAKPAPTPRPYPASEQAAKIALAEKLKSADRAEIYLLDFKEGAKGESFMLGTEGNSVIAQRKTLIEAKFHSFAARWNQLLAAELSKVSRWCHFPMHGVRFYERDTVLFETSICWGCRNFCMPIEGKPNCVGLPQDPVMTEIEKFFDAELPLPKKE